MGPAPQGPPRGRRGQPRGRTCSRPSTSGARPAAGAADLRFIALVHDAFKHAVRPLRPKTGENHHAMRARRFAEEYTDEERLLATIELHDRPYHLWRRLRRTGHVSAHRWTRCSPGSRTSALFVRFVELDGSTEGKTREPIEWLAAELRRRTATCRAIGRRAARGLGAQPAEPAASARRPGRAARAPSGVPARVRDAPAWPADRRGPAWVAPWQAAAQRQPARRGGCGRAARRRPETGTPCGRDRASRDFAARGTRGVVRRRLPAAGPGLRIGAQPAEPAASARRQRGARGTGGGRSRQPVLAERRKLDDEVERRVEPLSEAGEHVFASYGRAADGRADLLQVPLQRRRAGARRRRLYAGRDGLAVPPPDARSLGRVRPPGRRLLRELPRVLRRRHDRALAECGGPVRRDERERRGHGRRGGAHRLQGVRPLRRRDRPRGERPVDGRRRR